MTIEENYAIAVHLNVIILITCMSIYIPSIYFIYVYVKILINIHKCNLIIKNYIIFKALSFEYSTVI